MKLTQQVVPITVLCVVVMMILPLPNWILDILLCLNISFSIALLLSAATVSVPEKFTVLPTVILLSTLFRLALNVSTTRQILGTGEAPEVVSAFGLFVVGGSVVVGLVIFLIITIIQFIVISKGAERVAEVAARFTLDAMPGKQMSIDADLRSGSLSLPEARERRGELQRESRLYGSLDGAMKFIKGDAIAGLVITALNMGAGIIIGVVLHGMNLNEATTKYTLYTVGDGLVSQLPALLVSIAAGLVVTRVADRGDTSVGEELFSQIAREPQIPALTALFLLALVFLPGLPTSALIGCAFICVFIALARKALTAKAPLGRERFVPQGIATLSLRLSESALRSLGGLEFVARISKLRRETFTSLGVIVPEPELELQKTPWTAELIFYGETVASVAEADSSNLGDLLITSIESLLKSRICEFVNDTQTRLILEANEGRCPDLINSLIPSVISITQLTRIFKSLLREQVPIVDVSRILQGVLDSDLKGDEENKDELLLRSVRKGLKNTIGRVARAELHNRRPLRLSTEVEQLLIKILEAKSPCRSELAINIRKAVREAAQSEGVNVLIVPERLREFAVTLLEGLDLVSYILSESEFESSEYREVSILNTSQLRAAA